MGYLEDSVADVLLPAHQDDWSGRSVTLRKADGTELVLTAVRVGPITGSERGDEEFGRGSEQARDVVLLKDDITTNSITIEEWKELDVGGVTYAMHYPPVREDAKTVTVSCLEIASTEESRPGYRED